MSLTLNGATPGEWRVEKIAVVGPGIVGTPMAALLAHARIREGTDQPARVVVVQRASRTSGWKVDAINSGRSPIGGVEPGLDDIVRESVEAGVLSATHDYADVADADVIIVAVQTDKNGFAPEYGPLMEALSEIARALQNKPAGNIPVIVFESTLAPSSMHTVVRPFFAERGLEEGRDILLGNSPNRVMPGRLVERVAAADKLVAGLHPATPQLIKRLYSRIVTGGELHATNSLTAEIVKTLENAYRDVRIAFAAEVARWCDANDIDFYALRQRVNERLARTDAASTDARAVPVGALLVPTVGVGGHCLPKDGILLWWRALERERDSSRSLILESRHINDESPAETKRLAERRFGAVEGKKVALLGVAYRFDSEDTRNSPTLVLARNLIESGNDVVLHDPHVMERDQNLERTGTKSRFTRDLDRALSDAELVFLCTAHAAYADVHDRLASMDGLRGVVDACNLIDPASLNGLANRYTGIGRGSAKPDDELTEFVVESFRAMERGVANELEELIDFLNAEYAPDDFNRTSLAEVRRLARTCTTGCDIAEAGAIGDLPEYNGFQSRLARVAAGR
ncbi:MAG TPA: nucleotide sugar dehydrogenase [Gemmatimonadaceae bacterium]|nr:nucleotide sugar dehydrogenase [Gemmatimonadaceae bacterium]